MELLIVHIVLLIVALRLGLYCVMRWRLLWLKHKVAGSRADGRERFFLFALPVLALAMAAGVVASSLALARMLAAGAA